MFGPHGLYRTIAGEFQLLSYPLVGCDLYDTQIPDKSLDEPEPADPQSAQHAQADIENTTSSVTSPQETPFDSDDEDRDERRPMLRIKHSRPDFK